MRISQFFSKSAKINSREKFASFQSAKISSREISDFFFEKSNNPYFEKISSDNLLKTKFIYKEYPSYYKTSYFNSQKRSLSSKIISNKRKNDPRNLFFPSTAKISSREISAFDKTAKIREN